MAKTQRELKERKKERKAKLKREVDKMSRTSPKKLKDRSMAVNRALFREEDVAEVAERFRHTETWVRRWESRARDADKAEVLEDRPRSGRPPEVTPDQVDDMIDQLRQIDGTSERGLARTVGLSRSKLRRLLHRHGVDTYFENAIHRDVAPWATRVDSLVSVYIAPRCRVWGLSLRPDVASAHKQGRPDQERDIAADWDDVGAVLRLADGGHTATAPEISLLAPSVTDGHTDLKFVVHLAPDFETDELPNLGELIPRFEGAIVDALGWEAFGLRILRTLRRRRSICVRTFDIAVREYLDTSTSETLPPFLWTGHTTTAL